MKIEYINTTTEDLAEILFDNLSNYFEDLFVNMYKIKNIEKANELLDSKDILKGLYEKGYVVFFKDNKIGYLALPAEPTGEYNVLHNPIKWLAVGFGYNKQYNIDNSVLIKNNLKGKSTKELVDVYVSQLVDIELTKRVRRNAHKTPILVEGNSDTVLTAKNKIKKITGAELAIIDNKSKLANLNNVETKAIDLGVEYLNDRLDDEYNNVVAKILNIIGISNFVEDKAERVQSAEVEANEEYTDISYNIQYEELTKACEKINKMFNLDLSVEYNVFKKQTKNSEEVENDEQLYSGVKNDN